MTVTISGTSGLTFPDSSTQAVGFYGFKNRIINGRMEINQRGLTGPTSGYFVDRWQVSGVSSTSLQTVGLPTGYTQAISIARSVAGTATAYQNIESKNVFDLNGQQVAVSFWAKNVSGVGSITVNLSYANTTDTFASVTSIQTVTASSSPSSSWAYYTATFNALPSSVANGLQLNINAVIASSGTLEITGVQLEKGSTATSFDFRSIGTELALCQRYCPVWTADTTAERGNLLGQVFNSTTALNLLTFAVPARVPPTGLTSTGAFTQYNASLGGLSVSALSFNNANIGGASFTATVSSGLVAGNCSLFQVNGASSASRIIFTGCEL